MARITRSIFGIGLVLALGATSRASAQTAITVIIQVENYAALESGVLIAAERVADDVYAEIGVHLVWVDNDEQAAAVLSPSKLVRVRLLSEDMAQKKIQADGLKDGVLAVTPTGGNWVYVLVDRVKIAADSYSRDRGTVFGLVLAHEIGHVLLPAGSHSDSGIMQDNVIRQKGDSRFDERQGQLIRDLLGAGR